MDSRSGLPRDPQQTGIVELRFFGRPSADEAARVLDVSPSTVARGWRLARVWLVHEQGE
ncbi:MAG: hypothetical protein HYR85_07010 [Planctomycetes bacterium]|nr:hypothetical protein [Planctomycetota bacterium]MBI3843901.1 hypothetical protein [Planctomycetota bacterium]